MELIQFYWPNLIAGFLLSLSLGLIGIHTIARNQSLESFVLGQELQSGIIFGAFFLNLIDMHADHGFHWESIFSLLLAIVLHLFFFLLIKRYNLIRIELSIAYVFILLALNNLFMSLDPMIEGHMVNSLLGDIVTASKVESLLIGALSLAFIFYGLIKRQDILADSVEYALFNEGHTKKSHQFFLLIFMSLSVHILGLVFTLCMLLLTPLCMLMAKIKNYQFAIIFVMLINGLSVVIGFAGLGINDRVPTSVSIVLVCALFCIAFLLINSFKRRLVS